MKSWASIVTISVLHCCLSMFSLAFRSCAFNRPLLRLRWYCDALAACLLACFVIRAGSGLFPVYVGVKSNSLMLDINNEFADVPIRPLNLPQYPFKAGKYTPHPTHWGCTWAKWDTCQNVRKCTEPTSMAINPGPPSILARRSTHFEQEGPGSSQYGKDCPQHLQGISWPAWEKQLRAGSTFKGTNNPVKQCYIVKYIPSTVLQKRILQSTHDQA